MDILFVEDETIARLGLTKLLKDAGHIVDSSETADEAIDCMITKKYDLIILDVMIPPSKRWQCLCFSPSRPPQTTRPHWRRSAERWPSS